MPLKMVLMVAQNEANAVAGVIIRKYGKIHPELYE
jgi:hypothetical protein